MYKRQVYERIYVFPAYSRFNVADNYDYFFIFADRKCRGVFRPVTKSSMQQSNYIIEVKNVSKFFGDKIALDNINLYVKKGEFVTILGPSGCGKTTLLRLIAGFQTASEGEIRIAGQEITQTPPHKRPVNTVFQKYALFPHLNVYDNIAFGLKLKKLPKQIIEKKVKAALRMVGMTDYEYRDVNSLSGGQQQRVALARALVAQPGLLLLDEPLSNLDAKLRESMRFEILSIQKALGITVVYVTHDQGEAMAMSDRVVVMSKGVVQQIGAPHEIYTNPANKMVADFIGLVNFMQGEVSDDRVYLQGTTASFPNTSGVSGSATIAVRPENITMSRGGGMLEGTLTHRFYLGDAVDYRVTVGDHDVRVIVKGADLKEFADGEKVYLDFEKVMIFDRE